MNRSSEGDYESQSGFDAMQRILALQPRPTAVFAFDDPMAIGAICAAWEAGVKVPDDISIIGYDDVEMARFSSPPLTTIRHPKAETGPAGGEASGQPDPQQGAGSGVDDGTARADCPSLGQTAALIRTRCQNEKPPLSRGGFCFRRLEYKRFSPSNSVYPHFCQKQEWLFLCVVFR